MVEVVRERLARRTIKTMGRAWWDAEQDRRSVAKQDILADQNHREVRRSRGSRRRPMRSAATAPDIAAASAG